MKTDALEIKLPLVGTYASDEMLNKTLYLVKAFLPFLLFATNHKINSFIYSF